MKNLSKLSLSFLLTVSIYIISCKKTEIVPVVDTKDYIPTMVGTWNFAETCTNFGAGTNKIIITKSTTATDVVIIDGLSGNFDYKILATVSGSSFVFKNQKYNNGGLEVSGTGNLEGSTLKLTYNHIFTSSGATVNSCTSTGKKN